MLVAAPLAAYIPLAALAAVLAIVVVEHGGEGALRRHPAHERAARRPVLLATFLLTVLRDLTEGIAVGVVLGAVLFMHRMAQLVEVHHARDHPRGGQARRRAVRTHRL